MPRHESAAEVHQVLLAQAGDREALDRLLRDVQEPLFRYLLRLVGNRQLAEDILQEVFLQIYRKLGWLREPAVFRPWCYRIASRAAFRALRKERRRWEEPLDDLPAGLDAVPPPDPPGPGLLERLPGLLEQVSPASRAVLALHYLHELSLQEVADILEISPGTAKSRLAYGLAALRKQVGA